MNYDRERVISIILGFAVVVVLGLLIGNYFLNKTDYVSNTTAPTVNEEQECQKYRNFSLVNMPAYCVKYYLNYEK